MINLAELAGSRSCRLAMAIVLVLITIIPVVTSCARSPGSRWYLPSVLPTSAVHTVSKVEWNISKDGVVCSFFSFRFNLYFLLSFRMHIVDVLWNQKLEVLLEIGKKKAQNALRSYIGTFV